MSYADMAAKGPKQSPEEVSASISSRAPPVPSLEQHESGSSDGPSLIDVDSPHVQSVKSDFEDQAVKTETQATRIEHENEDKARAESKKLSEQAESAKKQAAKKSKEVKAGLKKDGKTLADNKDNPVVIGNAVIWGIAIVALGVGAYKKNSEGQLDWKTAGTVGGIVAAFGVADYFGSKWLTENKYPLK